MRIFIKTFGCSANKADSLYMKTLLIKNGYVVTDNYKDSELVIINSCNVKQHAETKFWKEIRKCLKDKKKIIAAGCVPQSDPNAVKRLKELNISIIGVRDIDKIIKVVKSVEKNKVISILNGKNKRFHKIKLLVNDIIGILPINEGCLGNCSYCITKLARGKLLSYSIKEIKEQFINYLSQGVKEIWITSQDSGAYGKDIHTDLCKLLKELLSIDKDYIIRIGMMNPNHFWELRECLINIIKDKRVFKFLHIPIQSANDRILNLMRRPYNSKLLKKVFDFIYSKMNNITIATDVICGFPTETDKEFDETLKFISYIKPDVINISRFWPRPYTEASKMKQLYNQIPIRRAKELHELYEKIAYEKNKRYINKEVEVLIDEIGKNNTMIGRDICYKQVIINKKVMLGTRLKVKIKKVTPYDLRTF